MVSFSGLGNGWRIVVLGTQEEYDFIREGQRSFNSSAPYWIGGSANTTLNEVFSYSYYMASSTTSSGNYLNDLFLFNVLNTICLKCHMAKNVTCTHQV